MGEETEFVLNIDPGQVRTAGQVAQDLADDICALAHEIAPAAYQASPDGLTIGASLRSVVPQWEDHLRAVCASIEHIGSMLITVADGLAETDAGNATDVEHTTTGTTVWPGP
jgi:hypothetical protein